MKLVTYNIQYCKGRDGRFDLERIVREVQGADVIALQEVERFWPRSGDVDQVEGIADALGGYYWVYGPGVDLHAEGAGRLSPGKQHRRQFGNMLLSRQPIIYSRHHLLPKYGSVGPLSIQRSAIEGVVDYGEAFLRLYSVHLTHLSAETRLPQVQRLLELHADARREGVPISGDMQGMDWGEGAGGQEVPAQAIMMGDFNCTPESKEYDLMVGPVSDYGGRISNPEGFVDAWVQAGNGELEGITSDIHGVPARLDYFFVSTALRDRVQTCRIDDQAEGSDHFPVWLEL